MFSLFLCLFVCRDTLHWRKPPVPVQPILSSLEIDTVSCRSISRLSTGEEHGPDSLLTRRIVPRLFLLVFVSFRILTVQVWLSLLQEALKSVRYMTPSILPTSVSARKVKVKSLGQKQNKISETISSIMQAGFHRRGFV